MVLDILQQFLLHGLFIFGVFLAIQMRLHYLFGLFQLMDYCHLQCPLDGWRKIKSTYSTRLVLECESAKGSGIFCNTRPLIFSGAITFDSYSFNYLGTQQQALCYLSLQQKISDNDDRVIDFVMAANLSNCHQIRINSACICPISGICSSVGADGRMFSSLNGRLAPKNVTDIDNFMHGRALLQLISHRNNPINYEEDNAENKSTFCYSHIDCLAEKFLEVRLGDCAILEQKNVF
ncbi:unnamed protein product [Meloidogyne enterolobii]|uniref:Uncharacterized protein n=1 Tax=Meloidogyne enterolobii TaxID=390850 RepID=A0ACB0XYL9_MELEN